MIVEVKQEHIDNGTPEDCKNCAVALALQEKLGTDYNVVVNQETIGWQPHHKNGNRDKVYFDIEKNNEHIDNTINCKDQLSVNCFVSNYDKSYNVKYIKTEPDDNKNAVHPFKFELEIAGV
tara:strand:+ start:92 stop:454 length:363 start_codon:yes stop_codon:yes gene_type:complete